MKAIENKVFVFDNIIDVQYQENIKNILMGDQIYNGHEFSWYFTDDVTLDSPIQTRQKRPALVPNSYKKFITNRGNHIGQPVSQFHQLFVELITQSCYKLNLNQVNVIQGRSFLQFPLNLKSYDVDTPHIDLSTIDHFVMLYYVCDSDGDTIIYNEKDMCDQYTIKEKVTPKQGRVVLFDGGLYHTAEQPLNNNRCIVNYDLE